MSIALRHCNGEGEGREGWMKGGKEERGTKGGKEGGEGWRECWREEERERNGGK